VIRFIRACIGLKDTFYNNNIIKSNIFDPIMQVWRENKNRYNLINSAIIEMLEFIRTEGIKGLLTHLVETYKADFESINYVETFPLMIKKYDQISGNTGIDFYKSTSTFKDAAPTKEREDEEKYFDAGDEKPSKHETAQEDDVVNEEAEEFFLNLQNKKQENDDDDEDLVPATTKRDNNVGKIRINLEEPSKQQGGTSPKKRTNEELEDEQGSQQNGTTHDDREPKKRKLDVVEDVHTEERTPIDKS
jgi:hypothetical protein